MDQEKELTVESLKQFFEERPAISVRGLSEHAGMNGAYLHQILKGTRPLSEKSKKRIFGILKKYGYGCE